MHVNETDYNMAEAYGTLMWLWIFVRAREGLPIMYGYKHAWDAH